ncbi:MAG TPA: hypothetical protein VK014_09335 [Cyclobacteriaceae bacterium]|nr:hypothetical protein [Cyclobacteriaceae bacterium]
MKTILLRLIQWPLLEILSSIVFLLFLSACQEENDINSRIQTEVSAAVQDKIHVESSQLLNSINSLFF